MADAALGRVPPGHGERRHPYGHELLAVPADRKDGSRISVEFSIILPRDEEGRIVGAVAIIRDVTARWRETQALRARIASLEAPEKKPATPGTA